MDSLLSPSTLVVEFSLLVQPLPHLDRAEALLAVGVGMPSHNRSLPSRTFAQRYHLIRSY
jgi:hypothetical protein